MENKRYDDLYDKLSGIFDEDSIFKDVPMHIHTSFKVGGNAAIMVLLKNSDEILKSAELAKEYDAPYFVIGNGSNLLVGDYGIEGLVIKLSGRISNVEIDGDSLYAEAGAKLASIALNAQVNSLTGFEFAHGIPGTLGGAVMMNAGAYGSEMKNVIEYVDALDEKGNTVRLFNEECEFGYRTSVFERNNYIILGAKIKLSAGDKDEIMAEMRRLMELRREKQPFDMPSAGSTFKRPVNNFAGGLIEQAGLKGYRYKNAMVSDKHAGFVVNCGGATASEVMHVINTVRDTVNEKFGVMLEPEVKMIGRFE